ncbi:MAG: bifunctional folylpolyglutamate synthase/dihydrofolate synthase, partial [Kiloniellales bacterium]
IDEAELSEILEVCEARNGTTPITFFEITTAAALLAFSRDPADIVLLETGLGGRLDATNVLARPRLTVITPVSIDHVQYLGRDLEQMAFEKAGILKPGVPAVIGPQPETVLTVIERRAAELGAPLHRFGKEWHARGKESGFVFQGRDAPQDYPRPALAGGFQIENAATALACADLLDGFALDQTARRAGLARARWPGRLQRLSRGPLAALLPETWELWLDGGHNPSAGHALAETLTQWRDRPLHLVLGMLDNKDLGGFLKPLAPLAGRVQTVAIAGAPASLSAEQAAAEAKAAGIAAQPSPDLDSALRAVAAGSVPGRILICGSLYLAGQVLAENG